MYSDTSLIYFYFQINPHLIPPCSYSHSSIHSFLVEVPKYLAVRTAVIFVLLTGLKDFLIPLITTVFSVSFVITSFSDVIYSIDIEIFGIQFKSQFQQTAVASSLGHIVSTHCISGVCF